MSQDESPLSRGDDRVGTGSAPSRSKSGGFESTPYEVIYRENKVNLRYYETDAENPQETAVLFAYAFINTPSILDIRPDRSVVGQFLDRGFDVYVVDWGFPSNLDVHLTLDDFVNRYLDNCVEATRKRSGSDSVHLIGVSTGSPVAVMYAALFPEKVAALGLQGPPLDFSVEEDMLDYRQLVASVDPQLLVDTVGNVPAELLDFGFSLRKPVEYTLREPLELLDSLDDPEFLDRKTRVARWAFDGPDMAGETYRQFVEELLVENKLIENRLTVGGRDVDIANIAMPVALVLGEDDKFVPEAASRSFLDAVPSDETAVFEFPTGHVGTFVDETAHEDGWPRVCDWFARE